MENCFRKHGATAKGMDWPNQNDLKRRFDVLTDIITPNGKNDSKIEILDLGCGVGLLIDFLDETNKLRISTISESIYQKKWLTLQMKNMPNTTLRPVIYCKIN